MPQRRNNPNNQFVKKSPAPEPKGDRNRMVIEGLDEPMQPEGRFSDRIKVPPMDEEGRATDRALRGWPEGLKRT